MNNKTRCFALALLCAIIAASSASAVKVSADTGPKPSVTVCVNDIPEGGKVYVTLLSKNNMSGPYRADGKYYKEEEVDLTDKAFAEYKDADGFYYLYNYRKVTANDNRFRWGYYPPTTFKILIYSEKDNSFLVSGVLERYAFSSYYTVGLKEGSFSQNGELLAENSYDYVGETCRLIARILFTLLVEVGIAYAFGYRKKSFAVILAANLVTQIGLNVALNLINYSSGFLAFLLWYIALELLVVIVESVFYMIAVPKIDKDCPVKLKKFWVLLLYSLAANVASFATGALIFWGIGI